MTTAKSWHISPLYLEHGMCANDGSIVIMEGDGFDAEPVATVLPTVPIKRGQGHKLTDDQRRDDRARLIAATPALLEALRVFASIGIGENEDYRPTIRLPREAIIAARAAVDAATGEKT